MCGGVIWRIVQWIGLIYCAMKWRGSLYRMVAWRGVDLCPSRVYHHNLSSVEEDGREAVTHLTSGSSSTCGGPTDSRGGERAGRRDRAPVPSVTPGRIHALLASPWLRGVRSDSVQIRRHCNAQTILCPPVPVHDTRRLFAFI